LSTVFSKLAIPLALLVIPGCVAAATSYSQTLDGAIAPRESDCSYRIQNSFPNPAEYEEIGTVNGCSGTNNINKYKRGIQPKVCTAGGELVAAQVNGYGDYCLGTVFRRIK
jgi:hypothetical protein